MAIISPTGDQNSKKYLWWRCVFIAAAVQPVLILLFLIFRSTVFGKTLLILYYPGIAIMFQIVCARGLAPVLPILYILLPVCFVLYSFFLGTIFYFVRWLIEKDY